MNNYFISLSHSHSLSICEQHHQLFLCNLHSFPFCVVKLFFGGWLTYLGIHFQGRHCIWAPRLLALFKVGHSRPLFLYFHLFNAVQYNFCSWLVSNRGLLASEATTLPTEPQPLPTVPISQVILLFVSSNNEAGDGPFKERVKATPAMCMIMSK